jgi:hypothetical protein
MGAWGANLRATVDNNVSPEAAQDLGVAPNQLFNVTVTDEGTGVTETHRNITVVPSIRRVDQVHDPVDLWKIIFP